MKEKTIISEQLIRKDDLLWSKLFQFLQVDEYEQAVSEIIEKGYIDGAKYVTEKTFKGLQLKQQYINDYFDLLNRCIARKKLYDSVEIAKFKTAEEKNVITALQILEKPSDEIMSIPFQVSQLLSFTTSSLPVDIWLAPNKNHTLPSQEHQYDVVIQPKYLATGNFTTYPLYLVNDKKFFMKLFDLKKVFTGNHILKKSVEARPELELEYIEFMTLFYIKRYLILQLIIPA